MTDTKSLQESSEVVLHIHDHLVNLINGAPEIRRRIAKSDYPDFLAKLFDFIIEMAEPYKINELLDRDSFATAVEIMKVRTDSLMIEEVFYDLFALYDLIIFTKIYRLPAVSIIALLEQALAVGPRKRFPYAVKVYASMMKLLRAALRGELFTLFPTPGAESLQGKVVALRTDIAEKIRETGISRSPLHALPEELQEKAQRFTLTVQTISFMFGLEAKHGLLEYANLRSTSGEKFRLEPDHLHHLAVAVERFFLRQTIPPVKTVRLLAAALVLALDSSAFAVLTPSLPLYRHFSNPRFERQVREILSRQLTIVITIIQDAGLQSLYEAELQYFQTLENQRIARQEASSAKDQAKELVDLSLEVKADEGRIVEHQQGRLKLEEQLKALQTKYLFILQTRESRKIEYQQKREAFLAQRGMANLLENHDTVLDLHKIGGTLGKAAQLFLNDYELYMLRETTRSMEAWYSQLQKDLASPKVAVFQILTAILPKAYLSRTKILTWFFQDVALGKKVGGYVQMVVPVEIQIHEEGVLVWIQKSHVGLLRSLVAFPDRLEGRFLN
jgi:hypothetical protein